MSHTYALLEVDVSTYRDIEQRLRDARYDHAIDCGVIDMHGIAIDCEQSPWRKGNCPQCGALIYLGHAHICNTERSSWEIMHGEGTP